MKRAIPAVVALIAFVAILYLAFFRETEADRRTAREIKERRDALGDTSR